MIIIVIIVGGIIGSAIYILWNNDSELTRPIKIGICAAFSTPVGENIWQGAVLAAEEINAEGGIIGRQIELVREDTQESAFGGDLSQVVAALTRLITYHKVDFLLGGISQEGELVAQDIIAEHKILYIGIQSFADVLTQRVLDDYDRYKYFFKLGPNATALSEAYLNSILTLREYTGFNKIAYLADDLMWTQPFRTIVGDILPNFHNFDTVYRGLLTPNTVDFTSYLAQAEAAEAEILVPVIGIEESGISFIKEWHDRQSPMVIWGIVAGGGVMGNQLWEVTDGKCKHLTGAMNAVGAGYPISNKTLPMRKAFLERWGYYPDPWAAGTYDAIRTILPDAIERAGTIEIEALIQSLERIDVATGSSPRFVYTSSHDIMFGPGYDEQLFFQFQVNGLRVPVYPRELMEEAGATYTFPDWPGPWDE
jgi:branched-chain amino acid transport system substrate-binding protein